MNVTKKAIAAILETALRIIILMIVISFVYKAGVAAYDFGYRIFAERPMTMGAGRDVIVTVPENSGVREIGEILRQHGLIRDANLFFCQELLSAFHGKLMPGTYTLNTSMTVNQMMSIMSQDYVEKEDESDEESSDEVFDEEDISGLSSGDSEVTDPEELMGEPVEGSEEEGSEDGGAGDGDNIQMIEPDESIDVIDAVIREDGGTN